MMTRDGQPSPRQTKMMGKVFVIATLLGMLVVFLNVTLRSYSIRMQQAELKKKQGTEQGGPAGAESSAPVDAQSAAVETATPVVTQPLPPETTTPEPAPATP